MDLKPLEGSTSTIKFLLSVHRRRGASLVNRSGNWAETSDAVGQLDAAVRLLNTDT